ncbi:MAG: CRTAC1 family protein [Luteolibacter sp.]
MNPPAFPAQRISRLAVISCLVATSVSYGQESAPAETLFNEAKDVIPLEDTLRRKWDNALVADLDQDGKMDLLLTEHGKQANIYWNDGGKFSEPVNIIDGDTHGVAAGDYDQDGLMDVIIYHGGGGGKKPRNPVAIQIGKDRKVGEPKDFDYFDRSRGRAAKLIDTNNEGVLDLVLTVFPLDTQKEIGANQLYTHSGDGDFQLESKLPQAQWMGFKMLTTDFNNDGDADLIFYGGANMVALKGAEGHAFTDVSEEIFGGLAKTTFVTSLTEIDYDNDGDFDLFVTRADHHFSEECCYDPESDCFGYYVFAAFVKDVDYQYDLKIEGDFQMENLQMAFPTYDGFIGKEMKPIAFNEDRHGSQSFTLTRDEAEGYPDKITETGLYVGYLGDDLWRVGGKTKSSTSGVVLNVTDAPEPTAQKELPARLFENRDGKFVDVSAEMGIAINVQTTSAAAGDLNNDGWSDLIVIKIGDTSSATEQLVYLNDGGTSFKLAENAGIISEELGATGGHAEIFDFDEDGDLDLIYSNERGLWHLMENNAAPAENNFVIVKVGSSPEGKATAQGAVLTLKAGDNIYRRVVGATSANFSLSMNTHLHVGLGAIDKVDEATVRWSNGETQTVSIDAVNKSVPAGKTD